jgi:WD40 repeat protein
MLRLRAFRPTSDKVVKIQLHPTHPWLVTADANDRVSVWDWEHRQVPLANLISQYRGGFQALFVAPFSLTVLCNPLGDL